MERLDALASWRLHRALLRRIGMIAPERLGEQPVEAQLGAVAEDRQADCHAVVAGPPVRLIETLAERLSKDATAIPDDVRRDFEKISLQMGNVERVMRPLDLCPAETDE